MTISPKIQTAPHLAATAMQIVAYLDTQMAVSAANVPVDFDIHGLSPASALRAHTMGFLSKPMDPVVQPEHCLVITTPELAGRFASNVIAVTRPRLAFALAAKKFLNDEQAAGFVHQTAVIDPSANVHPSVSIGCFCVIGPRVTIGALTVIANHVVIGADVAIGGSCRIGSNTVIGEVGFGVEEYDAAKTVRMPHIGGVILGDFVEIGSMNSIAAGTIEPTRLGDYVQSDNLVHIAHNCNIGAGAIITACAELSGSVTLGERVWIGPNASLIQGITLGADCLVGLGSVVRKSAEENRVLAGVPARDLGARR
jgi:UDP-3-O-[3-hydroxymyristoyl] glucosamine N-acyltransferase LpxD